MTKTMNIRIAGFTFNNRQSKLWTLRKNAAQAKVILRREPKNKHDANAIKVMVFIQGMRPFDIGYIPANIAKEIAPMIDANTIKTYVYGFDTIPYIKNNKKVITGNIRVKLYTPKAA